MSETLEQLTQTIESWQKEDAKFIKGNNAAGTRARKALQEISRLVKERRKEITEVRTARKESKVAA